MDDQTDAQLLRTYAERRSDTAFAELVRRHIDLVHSAARRMVGDAHLAEDVTQATFLALAKNAAQLTERAVLAGWLHRTAQNIAAQTVRTDVRRRAREQEAAAMNELLAASPEADWEQIAPHLDAALGDLTEPERDAVLLRYFQRQSARDMAQTLGISDEAAQKRVSRAVDRLREFFAKRGVTVGTSGLAVVISANAVQAAPVGLALTISTAAALTGTTLATTATVTAAKTIAMTALQKTIVAATIAVLAGAGIYTARQFSENHKQGQIARQQSALVLENQDLRQALTLATNQIQSLELETERLKRNTSELLKLRGEIALLRRQQHQVTSDYALGTESSNPTNLPTLRIHQATNYVSLKWKQAAVIGGWKMARGKRAVVFAIPTQGNAPDELTVTARYIAVADNFYQETLGKHRPENANESNHHALMEDGIYQNYLETMQKLPGYELLGEARITTRDGQQAQMQTSNTSENGQWNQGGIVFDVLPTISENGTQVQLLVFSTLIEDKTTE